MQRPRLSALVSASVAAMAVAPILGAVALAADPTVTVHPGDTLSGIADRTGVSVSRLVELNELADPNRIFPGQALRLADSDDEADAAPASDDTVTHVVQRGESLWGIARHYGVSLSAVIEANGIADPSRIFGGQRLVIPGASTAAKPSAPASAPPRAVPASMAVTVAARDDVRRVIVAEAERFGVPVAFALAVAWQESGWRQDAVSYAGAIGVMQLLPTTADWVGDTMLGSAVDIHAMNDNVRAGVRLLAHYFDRYDGNRDLVLAAYYQGQTAVDRHGVYGVSRPYIASIRALERIFGG